MGCSAKVRNRVRGRNAASQFPGGDRSCSLRSMPSSAGTCAILELLCTAKRLFGSALREFPERTELCVVRADDSPVAAGLLLHGWGVTEVPSASSIRNFNHTCARTCSCTGTCSSRVSSGASPCSISAGVARRVAAAASNSSGERVRPLAPGSITSARALYERHALENPGYQRFIRIWQRFARQRHPLVRTLDRTRHSLIDFPISERTTPFQVSPFDDYGSSTAQPREQPRFSSHPSPDSRARARARCSSDTPSRRTAPLPRPPRTLQACQSGPGNPSTSPSPVAALRHPGRPVARYSFNLSGWMARVTGRSAYGITSTCAASRASAGGSWPKGAAVGGTDHARGKRSLVTGPGSSAG